MLHGLSEAPLSISATTEFDTEPELDHTPAIDSVVALVTRVFQRIVGGIIVDAYLI